MTVSKVNIRPGVNVLSVLRHLNYKPWFALGEFVDNAVQSAIYNWRALQQTHGEKYRLKVEIELDAADGGAITVRDNAAGIRETDYARAFRTAEIPPDRKGLSEFGMGMKSAGFWFSTDWSVRTCALGEGQIGTVSFNLKQIVDDSLEVVPVTFEPARQMDHFTEIRLLRPQKMPSGRTLSKIKDHLTGIYRNFLRDGVLELWFKGEPLKFVGPKILNAPHPRDPKGPAVEWKKEVDITLAPNRRVRGFVAIREEGSVAEAGLALFRRRRLIQGSADEGYRPEKIFGKSNDFRYQRIFGELHLEGFEVSHTKDGFQWDDFEDDLIAQLKARLNQEPLPMLRMALEHRVRPRTVDITSGADAVLGTTAAALQQAGPVIEAQQHLGPSQAPPPDGLPAPAEMAASRELRVAFHDINWAVSIQLANDPAIGNWLEVAQAERKDRSRTLSIRVNLAHPFMQRFGTDAERMEPLVRFAAAVAISETISRDQGIRQAGTMRRHINALLREILSKPGAEPS